MRMLTACNIRRHAPMPRRGDQELPPCQWMRQHTCSCTSQWYSQQVSSLRGSACKASSAHGRQGRVLGPVSGRHNGAVQKAHLQTLTLVVVSRQMFPDEKVLHRGFEGQGAVGRGMLGQMWQWMAGAGRQHAGGQWTKEHSLSVGQLKGEGAIQLLSHDGEHRDGEGNLQKQHAGMP